MLYFITFREARVLLKSRDLALINVDLMKTGKRLGLESAKITLNSRTAPELRRRL